MSCEIDAGRAISRPERPIHHGRIPSRYENCGSAAGKVLAVRAQVQHPSLANSVSTPPPALTSFVMDERADGAAETVVPPPPMSRLFGL